jgi:hypothetical protein
MAETTTTTPTTKRERDANEVEEKKLLAHVMVNMGELSAGRIFVGPFITERDSALKLSNYLGITHIVNMCPTTTAETQSGKPRDTWYTCYWAKEASQPVMLREPLPADFATQSDPKKRQYYWTATRRIITHLDSNSRIYVHNQTGCLEECILACALWVVWQHDTFVGVDALAEWLEHQNYLWMLDDPLDKQMMLDVVSKLATDQKRNTVLKYITRTPKDKQQKKE